MGGRRGKRKLRSPPASAGQPPHGNPRPTEASPRPDPAGSTGKRERAGGRAARGRGAAGLYLRVLGVVLASGVVVVDSWKGDKVHDGAESWT